MSYVTFALVLTSLNLFMISKFTEEGDDALSISRKYVRRLRRLDDVTYVNPAFTPKAPCDGTPVTYQVDIQGTATDSVLGVDVNLFAGEWEVCKWPYCLNIMFFNIVLHCIIISNCITVYNNDTPTPFPRLG